MDPVFGGILAGGLAGGLDLFGGLLTNSANAAEAARNRRFVAKMYKKRYQFTVDDMRKAGLNPVLAATNGGSVGSVPSPGGLPSFDNVLGSAAHSAMSAAQGIASIRKTEADSERADADTNLTQARKVEQDIRNKELPKTVRAQAFKAEAEASLANSASVIQRARTEFADQLAANEARQSHNDTINSGYRALDKFWDYQHNKKDYYVRPSAAEERNWWRAKKVLDSVGSGVSSAVGVGKFMRYMRYFR